MKCAWVIPMPIKGSGGFRTIFAKCAACQACGMVVDIYVYLLDTDQLMLTDELACSIHEWFGFKPDHVGLAVGKLPETYDAVIATAWDTAAYVARQDARRKLYFVQDYEPSFFPVNDSRLIARASYDLGLEAITMGRWLYTRMQDLGSHVLGWLNFDVDESVYHPLGVPRERAVCAIFQPEKDRRLPKTLLDACELLLEADEELTIYLYGSTSPHLVPPHPRLKTLGLLTREECNSLYNKCACGISLSATNPSRIPFEMMASGLHVVELGLENNMYDFPEGSPITFVSPTSPGIAEGVLSALGENGQEAPASLFASREREDDQFVRLLLGDPNNFAGDVPPFRAQHEVVEAGSAMRQRFNLLMERREQQAAECRTPLSAKGLSFTLVSEAPLRESEELRLAFWCSPDQSDLVWLPFEIDGRGSVARAALNQEAKGVHVAHLHFYAVDSEGQHRFLFAAAQAVSYADEQTDSAGRLIEFGSLRCRIDAIDDRELESYEPGERPNRRGVLGRIGSKLLMRKR